MHAHTHGWLVVSSILATLALSLAACGGDADGGDGGSSATNVNATLAHSDNGEYSISLDRETAPAGEVTFNLTNSGELEHEFEVVKTDVGADALPVEADKANVEAGGGEEIDEVEGMASGAEETLTVNLESGKYLLICNLPGHYGQGMVTAFTVE